MILGVIPARYASTRFPGKSLADVRGKSMIHRVYLQAKKAKSLDRVIVATDDKRIYQHVVDFGGEAEMTATHHESGTERLVELAEKFPDYPFVVNIQGDEPYIDPKQINLLSETLTQTEEVDIATLIRPITEVEVLENNAAVKVVVDHQNYALYFSRAAIPFNRDEKSHKAWLEKGTYYHHIGIYGFKREVLMKVPHMQPSPLEYIESLEQLRWLANGYRIRTAVSNSPSYAVDTPEDLGRLPETLG